VVEGEETKGLTSGLGSDPQGTFSYLNYHLV